MSERLQIPIAMWRVQYQLLGGHRRMMGVLMITATVIVAGTLGIRRLFILDPLPSVLGWVVNIIAALQIAAVVLAGCNAVYRSMLRDYQNKMIESHRLTPMTNLGVVFGYLLGSTIQILAIFVLFAVAGAILSHLGGLPVKSWLFGNLVLLSGGVTLWSAAVLIGMRPEKPISPAPILVVAAGLTVPIGFIPGAALILNVYSILFAVWVLTGITTVAAPAIIIVLGVNVVLTAFWVSTAAVKYRRPDLPAFNGGRGLFFLFMGLVFGAGGLYAFQQITAAKMPGFADATMVSMQWLGTLVGALLLALVPIAGAVKCSVLRERGASVRGWGDRLSPTTVALSAAVMMPAVMVVLGQTIWFEAVFVREHLGLRESVFLAWGCTVAACLVAALTMQSLFEVGYRAMKSPRFLVAMYVLFVWGLPPLIDLGRSEWLREFEEAQHYSILMGCSPVGTFIVSWVDLGVSAWPGLIVQGVIAVVLGAFAWRAVRGRRVRGAVPCAR